MGSNWILSFNGPDRAGLVELLSTAVSQCGGNWLESRMARMGGQFAGVARVTLDPQSEGDLQHRLAGLQAKGLSVSLTADSEQASAATSGVRARVDLVGQDRPGIVAQVSAVFARHGANVEDFSSAVESAAMAGGLLFRCEADLGVPGEAALEAIRADLERLAGDLMVDIAVRRG